LISLWHGHLGRVFTLLISLWHGHLGRVFTGSEARATVVTAYSVFWLNTYFNGYEIIGEKTIGVSVCNQSSLSYELFKEDYYV